MITPTFLLITPNNVQILLSDIEQGYPKIGTYCFRSMWQEGFLFFKVSENNLPDEEILYREVLAANDGFENLPRIINQFDMSWVPKIKREKTFTTQDITNLRNKLYDMLPTGEITTFDLIKQIKAFINHMDELTNFPNKPMMYKVQILKKDDTYHIMEIDKTIDHF